MAHATAVINVVGLTADLLAHAPALGAFARRHAQRRLRPVLPAVTCSVQSSMLTGLPVREHGIVGNGWFDAERAEIAFWKQSNRLVHGDKVWETARARDASVTCANMFWWYNMYSTADVAVTPRPIYKADGRKLPDIATEPPALRDELQAKHGQFPLFDFWGPRAGVPSSRWIADATRTVVARFAPTLTLVYLPHLDYDLQRYGPHDARIPAAVAAVDALAGELIAFLENRGVRVIVVSEYGIEAVQAAVPVNRILREAGAIRVRDEEGLEVLDAAASDAVAVADHQIAHVTIKDAASDPGRVAHYADMLRAVEGVDLVLDRAAQREHDVDHARAGDLVLVAEAGHWFSYRYWLDDARAPDFARTVDIHRKPGYDPCELFLDPALSMPRARIAWKLLRKKLGFRQVMDVIPLDEGLVRGSHGRVGGPPGAQPVLIAPPAAVGDAPEEISCRAVRDVTLACLFDS